MEIQKKNSNTISFDFKEEFFIYQLKDRNNTQTKQI